VIKNVDIKFSAHDVYLE